MLASADLVQSICNQKAVQSPLKRIACWSDCDEEIMPEPADSGEHMQVSVSAPGSSTLLFKNRRRTPLMRAHKKRRLLALNPLRGSAHAAAVNLPEQQQQEQQQQQQMAMGTRGMANQSSVASTAHPRVSNSQGDGAQAWTPVIALLLPQQLLLLQQQPTQCHPSGCSVACITRQTQLAAPNCSGGLQQQQQLNEAQVVQQLAEHLRNERQQQQPGRLPQQQSSQQQRQQQNQPPEQQQQLKQLLLQLLSSNSISQQEVCPAKLYAPASSAAAAATAAAAPAAGYHAVTQATRELLSLASTYASPALELQLRNEFMQQVKTAAAQAAATGSRFDIIATTAALLPGLLQSVTQACSKVQSLQAALAAIRSMMQSSPRGCGDPVTAAAAAEAATAAAEQAARVVETVAKAKLSALATVPQQQLQQVCAASTNNSSAGLSDSNMLQRLAAAVSKAAAATAQMPAGSSSPACTQEVCSVSSRQPALIQSLQGSSSNSTNSSSSNGFGQAGARTAAAAADSAFPRFQSIEQLLLSVEQLQRRQQ